MPIETKIVVYLEACDGPTRQGETKRKPRVDAAPVMDLTLAANTAVDVLQQAWAADHISQQNLAVILGVIEYALSQATSKSRP